MCFFLLSGKVAYIRLSCLIFLSRLDEILARPHLCKNALNKDISSVWARLPREKPMFFSVLCRRGDLPSNLIRRNYKIVC